MKAIDSRRPGSEEEADLCAYLLGPAWSRDVEAMDWLEDMVEKGSAARRTPPPNA